MDNQLLLKIAPIKKFSFLSSMEDWPVTFLILQRPFEILLGNYFNFVHSNVFCHFSNVLHNRWPSCLFSVQTKEFCMHTIHSVSAHITQLSKFQSNRNIESNIIVMPCQTSILQRIIHLNRAREKQCFYLVFWSIHNKSFVNSMEGRDVGNYVDFFSSMYP